MLERGVPTTSGRNASSSKRRKAGETGTAMPGLIASAEGRQHKATADASPKTGAPEGLPDLRPDRDLLLLGGGGGLGSSRRVVPG